MTKLDDMIKEALAQEDRQILAETEELGWFALSRAQFTGKLGWVTWVIMIVQSAMFIGGVWCAVQFFAAAEVLVALKWGLPGAVLMLGATVLKLSLMPQMQADRIIREIKRVELLLATRR